MTSDIKAIVAELERLDSVATPAPWPEDYCQGAVRHISRNVDQDAFYDGSFDGWSRYNDGPLIAAARNALPALLAELHRLWAIEAERSELLKEIEEADSDQLVELKAAAGDILISFNSDTECCIPHHQVERLFKAVYGKDAKTPWEDEKHKP